MKKNILFTVLLVFSSHLQAALITWDSTSNVYNQNDIFTLDVIGTGFIDLVDGGGVNISFDPNVLNVLSVSIDELVWNFGGAGISTGTINNVAGTVNGIMVNAFPPVGTADFIVASIQFQAVGLGISSLTLSEYVLNPWASGGSAINPGYLNGSVSAVPVPAAAWLFGSGLIALFSVARSKHKNT